MKGSKCSVNAVMLSHHENLRTNVSIFHIKLTVVTCLWKQSYTGDVSMKRLFSVAEF